MMIKILQLCLLAISNDAFYIVSQFYSTRTDLFSKPYKAYLCTPNHHTGIHIYI